MESTHRNLKFTAPLIAINAAMLSVILKLVLSLGYHEL